MISDAMVLSVQWVPFHLSYRAKVIDQIRIGNLFNVLEDHHTYSHSELIDLLKPCTKRNIVCVIDFLAFVASAN